MDEIEKRLQRLKSLSGDLFEDFKRVLPLELQLEQSAQFRSTRSSDTSQDQNALRRRKRQSSLEPQSGSLSIEQARHLLRRISVSAKPEQTWFITNAQVDNVVNGLINAALSQAEIEEPDWILDTPPSDPDLDQAYAERNKEYTQDLYVIILNSLIKGGLKDKLTLFWSNHFVTELNNYFLAIFGFRYWQTLHRNALGNFKQLTKEIGIQGSMLLYLDGNLNRRGKLNENYARELLELFTTGILDRDGNEIYSEDDIVEIARSLTGWTVNLEDAKVVFVRNLHDDRNKTIFEEREKFDYETLHDHLFETKKEEISWFICSKLYREFVHGDLDEGVVEGMATIFLESDFEISPVLRRLFASQAFFDEEIIGSKIKNPLEFVTGLLGEVMLDFANPNTVAWQVTVNSLLGQNLLNPPDVSGWKGGRDWINTSTLPRRWFFINQFLNKPRDDEMGYPGFQVFIDYFERLSDLSHQYAVFRIPVIVAMHISPLPLDAIYIPRIADDFEGNLEQFPLPDEVVNASESERNLCKLLLQATPWYEFDFYGREGQAQLKTFMENLLAIPEMQLI